MTIKLIAFVVPCFVAVSSVAHANTAPTPAATASAAAPASPAATELTVEGSIKKVVVKKKEIYVTPANGGKKMEFYFSENAQFMKAGQSVGFEALKEGQKVKVTYTQKGKRLNPTKAEILE